jgi:hypothetical protein
LITPGKFLSLLNRIGEALVFLLSLFTDSLYRINKKIKNTETVYKTANRVAAIFTIVPVSEKPSPALPSCAGEALRAQDGTARGGP